MNGIVGDADIIDEFKILAGMLMQPEFRILWELLELKAFPFSSLGVPTSTTDRMVWRLCQQRGLALVTSNRNKDDEDSLAAVIEEFSDNQAIPVFTIGNRDRFRKDASYRARVVDDLLDYLADIEQILGTGRQYLPKKAVRP